MHISQMRAVGSTPRRIAWQSVNLTTELSLLAITKIIINTMHKLDRRYYIKLFLQRQECKPSKLRLTSVTQVPVRSLYANEA